MKLVYLLLTLSSLFLTVRANAQQELETCQEACTVNLRPKVVSLIPRQRVYTDFEALIPYWQTCQYRCYRCHLTGMNRAMETLRQTFVGPEVDGQRTVFGLTRILNEIDISLEDSCYKRWEFANRLNDTASKFGF